MRNPETAARGRSQFWSWMFSSGPIETRPTEQVEVLLRSCHITAKCRFNASIRLRGVGTSSFITTTVLSLGLILIPMIQMAGIAIPYPSRVLNSLQAFLAVAVLIYSVINGTAHHETRAQSLNEGGDRLKELGRKLRTANEQARRANQTVDLEPYNQRYTKISTVSENHSRTDYSLAQLQAREIYHITGFPRLWLHVKVKTGHGRRYAVPICLAVFEALIALDLLGVTRILTNVLDH